MDTRKPEEVITRTGLVRFAVFIRADQIEALRDVHERAGVSLSEQTRRALDAALGTKRAARRRSATT